MIKVDTKKAQRKFVKISHALKGMDDVVMAELTRAAVDARNKIVVGIKRGTHTGMVYKWRGINPGEKPHRFMRSPLGHLFPVKKRNKPHTASAPGEFPADDTGELVNSIMMDSRKNETEVGSNIQKPPYPEFLEFGTAAMKPRPFMKPVVDELEKTMKDRVMSAIIRAAESI